MYKDSITLREQPWNTCMICLGGEGKGDGLIIVTLCTTTLWIYCVCIHCCRIALRSLFRGGICSDFSFQNIKLCVLKAERIKVNRMNYRITHGARVCRSFSFLHLSRTWYPQYVTSEQGWTNCTELQQKWPTLLLEILLKCLIPHHCIIHVSSITARFVCVCLWVCACMYEYLSLALLVTLKVPDTVLPCLNILERFLSISKRCCDSTLN